MMKKETTAIKYMKSALLVAVLLGVIGCAQKTNFKCPLIPEYDQETLEALDYELNGEFPVTDNFLNDYLDMRDALRVYCR